MHSEFSPYQIRMEKVQSVNADFNHKCIWTLILLSDPSFLLLSN